LVINDIQEKFATATAEEIKNLGRKVMVSTHDVSKMESALSLFEDTKKHFGDMHILVNNAGILRDAMVHKLTEENFDAVINVNLKGVFQCTQGFVRGLKELQHGGTIVNISSLAYLGNVGQTNYSAAKAGVVGMTRTWALELSKMGVRVNAIAPGLMETEMTQSIPEEVMKMLLAGIPLKRMGTPVELAKTVSFLAGPESSYITGQVLHLDGGMSVGI